MRLTLGAAPRPRPRTRYWIGTAATSTTTSTVTVVVATRYHLGQRRWTARSRHIRQHQE